MNIKHIVLDVDGVIIWNNWPFPSEKIMQKLSQIQKSWINISLCTAKPIFSIQKITEQAWLQTLHISDWWSVIINPVNNKILEENIIEQGIVVELVKTLLERWVYTELYTSEDYYIMDWGMCDITVKHNTVLERGPQSIDNLEDFISKNWIIKVMPIVESEWDRKMVEEVFHNFSDTLNLAWWVHPVILPLQFWIITHKGITKWWAMKKILEHYNCDIENVLAVWDSTSDWDFIQYCKYKWAMWNASDELIKKVKNSENWYVWWDVDEDGLLDILKCFWV